MSPVLQKQRLSARKINAREKKIFTGQFSFWLLLLSLSLFMFYRLEREDSKRAQEWLQGLLQTSSPDLGNGLVQMCDSFVTAPRDPRSCQGLQQTVGRGRHEWLEEPREPSCGMGSRRSPRKQGQQARHLQAPALGRQVWCCRHRWPGSGSTRLCGSHRGWMAAAEANGLCTALLCQVNPARAKGNSRGVWTGYLLFLSGMMQLSANSAY